VTTARPAWGERAALLRRGQGDREERSAAEASADSSPYQLPTAVGVGIEGIGQSQGHHGHDEDVAPIETNYRRGQHRSGVAVQNAAELRPKVKTVECAAECGRDGHELSASRRASSRCR
jgi:hypothetical protein